MGMSTHVVGIRPPDDDFKKHKAVYDACEAAGVSVPKETHDFFNLDEVNEPDEAGVIVNLPKGAESEYDSDMRQGIEVDLEKLPAGVKRLRFYNSW